MWIPFPLSTSRTLIDKEDARNATAMRRLFYGYIIHAQYAENADAALKICLLCGHGEVHFVATIIAIQVEHASTIINSLGHRQHIVDTWRGKHFAHTAAVEHTLANIT